MLKFFQAATTRIFFANSIFIPGWLKRWIAPVSFLVITVVGPTLGSSNQGIAQETDRRTGWQQSQENPEPSFQELLEYLGQWETDDGSWVDPTDLDWLLTPDQETGNDKAK